MCNLYRMRRTADEVAGLFRAEPRPGANFAEEVYPGYPGLVVAAGEVRTMNWGFPLALTGKQGQKLKPRPVTNAREDKLHTGFWRDSFVRRRCLPTAEWGDAYSMVMVDGCAQMAEVHDRMPVPWACPAT